MSEESLTSPKASLPDRGPTTSSSPTIRELFHVWLKIGLLSFGGPTAQIALMHRMIVEERSWLSERQYLNALSFCMLLPGPEAMQLATYTGWRLHGFLGGLLAGLLFVIPGALVVLALATIYAFFGDVPLVNALFLGVKACVLIVVIEALHRVALKVLHLPEYWFIAGLAFIGIFFLNLPFPMIIVVAALFGFLRNNADTTVPEETKKRTRNLKQTLGTIALWLIIWATPLVLLNTFAPQSILNDIGIFFSKLAVVTFGGAYAVLAYMSQDVVIHFGWLTAGEMMDGLGLAETTPGPLILVTEFVGFIAAFREDGLALGLLGALVTLWATFAPCFLWIFVGAPYIDWIGTQPRLRSALSGITAAVVGVILNLSIWFGLHVFFSKVQAKPYGPVTVWVPDFHTLDWRVILLSSVCGFLILKLHWSLTRVLMISAFSGAGLVWTGL
ncbi:chromate transporter [Kiloniella litopenaei]|uniref:Chromate transporter n=1 Tax=Kiloniella litopenaei TaxID=1549748 RepID=A0A0M2RDI9_9PROT|nr:chromate efflux transporter [Kiloniella litopenaei]KKJ78524.1 chromate transporter [Kiloniella litopenaei]